MGKATWWFDGLLHVLPWGFPLFRFYQPINLWDFLWIFLWTQIKGMEEVNTSNLWHRKQEKQIKKRHGFGKVDWGVLRMRDGQTSKLDFIGKAWGFGGTPFWGPTYGIHRPRASGSAKVAPRHGRVAPTEKKKHMRIEVCYIGATGVCWCFMGFIQNEGMLRVSCRVTMG